MPKRSVTAEKQLQQILKQSVHLEFNGNREVIIEDCCGILEYTENQVRINTSDYILRFQGKNLKLCTMTSDSIVLKGHIEHMDFLF